MSEKEVNDVADEMGNVDGEVFEPVKFVRMAMLMGSSAIVQSVLTTPDTFTMPGFELIQISDDTVCEPGMRYNSETNEFSIVEESDTPDSKKIEPVAEPEEPAAEQ